MLKQTLTRIAGMMMVFLLFSAITAKAQTMNEPKQTLDAREENIVTIAAFTANGNLDKLKASLQAGLNAGLTVNEIKEVFIQMYAYTGFPRSLNGLQTFMEVIKEREANGIIDPVGKEPSALPAGTNKDVYGEKVRMTLSGLTTLPPKAAYQLFAPGIDTFLKEHLFADIFGRGVLEYRERELATIAALAALGGTENQLQYHVKAAMNVGLKRTELEGMVALFDHDIGKKEAVLLKKVMEGIH